MDEIKKYLKDLFGEVIAFNEDVHTINLPLYMVENCEMFFVTIDGQTYVFVKDYKKQDINITFLKKRIKQIYHYTNAIPIFIFDSLRSTQRHHLIQNHIPFIQTNYQIYIPSVMINLSQKEIIKKEYTESFSIAAQVVYIYLLLNDIKETNAPRLALEIPYSKITLNRALAELVERKLLNTKGGATRKIYRTIEKNEMWDTGKKFLFNPVEKEYYIKNEIDTCELFYSGESALSRLGTDLNDSYVCFYATDAKNIKQMNRNLFINKYDLVSDHYSVLAQFKYNPAFLSKESCVDIISLYAQFKNCDDERIRIALEQLLEEKLNVKY